MGNWIADENPFKLAAPPKWWLQRLWDFDNRLVVIPSRRQMVYRLAQRHPPDPRIQAVEAAMWKDSETKMLASHGLVPVLSITPDVTWENPTIFETLKERAPWMQGGTDKFLAKVEAAEATAEQRRDADTDAMMGERYEGAWNMLRRRMGLGKTWHQPFTPMITPASS